MWQYLQCFTIISNICHAQILVIMLEGRHEIGSVPGWVRQSWAIAQDVWLVPCHSGSVGADYGAVDVASP